MFDAPDFDNDDYSIEDDFVDPDLGTCCGCGKLGRDVRNILMLPFVGPSPGKGWGCLECGLPGDGATAVVCDECQAYDVSLVEICIGYATEKRRVPFPEHRNPFLHDMSKHPGES